MAARSADLLNPALIHEPRISRGSLFVAFHTFGQFPAMNWVGKYPLRQLAMRGLHLARWMVPVAVVSAALALIEPYLLRGPTIEAALGRPAWELVTEVFGAYYGRLVTIGAVIWIIKSILLCWFTSKAFLIRNGFSTPLNEFLRYFVRYLMLSLMLYILFGTLALSAIFLASKFIYSESSPFIEKGVIGVVAFLSSGFAVMLLSFTAYWSYPKTRLADAIRATLRSIQEYGVPAYLFFCLRTLIDLVCGVAVPFLILRMPITYPLRLVGVAGILTVVIIWLRGVGFEYNNSHFWNEPDRQFRY